ncbi:hypothetical protein EJB05_49732, partial [Eragrostis curvula]
MACLFPTIMSSYPFAVHSSSHFPTDPRSGEASGAVNRSLSVVERARVTWGAAYFTVENYDRLVRVKTLIDPDNVFNHAQSIPPLKKQG